MDEDGKIARSGARRIPALSFDEAALLADLAAGADPRRAIAAPGAKRARDIEQLVARGLVEMRGGMPHALGEAIRETR